MRQKTTTKVFTLHYWRSFWFKYFLVILYFSDMFVKYLLGNIILGGTVWELQGWHRLSGNRAIHRHPSRAVVVHCVWTYMCIFSLGLCFKDICNSILSGLTLLRSVIDKFFLSSRCFWVPEMYKIRAFNFQHSSPKSSHFPLTQIYFKSSVE